MRWLTEDSLIQPQVRSPTGDSFIQTGGVLGNRGIPSVLSDALLRWGVQQLLSYLAQL
ncbi:hypothetical protein [Laspinema palackyanum]|uniref:hypothetical protein n=1 Tax=Laspinema palackyanum TaxID=3231601 RepID=UPI00345D4E2C